MEIKWIHKFRLRFVRSHVELPSLKENTRRSSSRCIKSSLSENVCTGGSQLWRFIKVAHKRCYKICQGRKVTENIANLKNIILVHEKCVQWAPRIYFPPDGTIKNLESEIARANKLKCSSCLKKGAALGCYMNQCKRTYHVPCAYETDCKWEIDGYLLMCPQHKSFKFPSEQNLVDELLKL